MKKIKNSLSPLLYVASRTSRIDKKISTLIIEIRKNNEQIAMQMELINKFESFLFSTSTIKNQ